MNKIRIRFSFLFKLVAFLAVLGVILFFVHRWQVSRQTEALLTRAREAAKSDDPSDAIRYYTQYTSVRKDNAEARVELAKIFEKAGVPERAFFYYEDALRIDPTLTEARKSIVDAALQIRREKDARDQIQGHLLANEPDNADLHWKLGICEQNLGDFSASRKHYEKAIELNPAEPKYALTYAELLVRRFNQAVEARKALDRMVEQAKEDPMAFVARGEWLQRERGNLTQSSQEVRDGLLETAWQDAQAALKLKPDDPDIASFYSSVAVEKREFDLARSAIQAALDKKPDEPRLYSELARIELGQGDADKAIAALQKGQAAKPGDFDLLWTEAQLQLDLGNVKEVERLVSEMKSRSFPPELLSYLDARVLASQGKWQEAVVLLEQFRSRFDRAQGFLKQVDFLLATCYRNLGNLDQELSSLRRCLNSDPLFTPARDALGVALFRAGRMQEALTEYNQVIAQPNASPASLLNFARILFLDGSNAKDNDWSQLNAVLAALDKYPEAADDVAILRAELLLYQEKRQEAEELIVARIKENNKSPQLHQALISIRSLSEDWDKVRLTLKEAGEAIGDTVALRLERARFLLRRDGDDVDKQQLDQLATPNDEWGESERTELAAGFASLFLSLREMERATKLASAVAESPAGQSDLTIHMMLFDIASMTEDGELMAKSLKKVKEIDKSGALWRVGDAIRLNLEAKKLKAKATESDIIRANQLFQDAIRQLTEAAVIRPAWSRIPRLKGEIYEEQENLESAMESYVEAINRGDYSPQMVSKTLRLLLQKGRFLDAESILRKTQDQKSPVSSELSRMASQIYLQMEDYDRAVSVATKKALESDTQEDHLWLAQIYAFTGKDAQAIEEYRTSIAKDPSVPAPWVSLIQYYARKENKEAALSALAEAESSIRESDRDDALAQAYQALGDLENANKYYQQALTMAPNSSPLLRRYAEFLLLAGASQLAEPILGKLIDTEVEASEIDRAWGRRSLALIIGLRKNDEAIKQARDLLNTNAAKSRGMTVEDKRVLAQILARRENPQSTDEAVSILEEITRGAPRFSLEDHFLLATVYKDRKDWNRYFSTMRAIMGNGGGENPAIVFDYANTLIGQGQIAEGELWLDRLRKIAPDALANVAGEVQVLYKQGNYKQIEELLEKSKTLPNGLEAMAILAERVAQLLERDNKPEVADTFWKFAETSFAQLTEQESTKRTALAGFFARTGNIDRAVKELDGMELTPTEFGTMVQDAIRAAQLTPEGAKRMIPEIQAMIEKHPKDALLQIALGDYYSWAGEIEQARAAYVKILEKDKEFVPALNNLAMILAASNVRTDEAMKAIEEAVKVSGPTDYLLDTRGIVKLAAGDIAGAEADMRQSIAGAARADRYFHLAQILMAQGRSAEAKQALETAQKEGVSIEVLHPIERAAYQKLVDALK